MEKAQAPRARAVDSAGRRSGGGSMGHWKRLLFVCLLGLAPSGCITWFTDPMGHHAAFKDTQRQYTNYVRWGEIEKASGFVDPALQAAFLERAPVFKGVRVTEYEVGDVKYEGDAATVPVTYRVYGLSTLVEQTIREEQSWYRENLSNTWRLRSDGEVFARALAPVQR
jgi:hypothetical protein